MLATILSVSIPAVSLIVVQIIISMTQDNANKVRYDMTIKEIKEDIARLESKQDKHNDLIERVYKLEEANAVQDNRLAVADHRLSDLESKVG